MFTWLIASLALMFAYPYIRGYAKHGLSMINVGAENRRMVDAIGVGFAFTIIASVLSVFLGMAAYTLGTFLFFWAVCGVIEYYQSR